MEMVLGMWLESLSRGCQFQRALYEDDNNEQRECPFVFFFPITATYLKHDRRGSVGLAELCGRRCSVSGEARSGQT